MFFVVSFIFRLISFIPMRVLNYLSYPLGWLVWKLSPTKRNSTLKNLLACYPDMTEGDRLWLARESMRHYVCNALETGKTWFWSIEKCLAQFDAPRGQEHLDAAREAGHGVLVLVPHFGNWEFSVHGLGSDNDTLALYKPGANSEFNAKMLDKRLRQGTQMAATNRAGLKMIYRKLSDSGLVVQLPDQEPSVGKGRFIPFFGIPAWTGILAPRLIQRTGCRLVFAVCRRTAKGRYQMVFQPAGEAIYSSDMDEALAELNRGVERCIAIDPAQYLWAYKRFKNRPEGEAGFYTKAE